MSQRYDIIFLCPKFFEYEEKYAAALNHSQRVYSVFYDENDFFLPNIFVRIANFILSRVFFWRGGPQACVKYNRLLNHFMLRNKHGFQRFIIKKMESISADNLVMIKGFGIDGDFIQKLRQSNNIKHVTLYQWDSIIRFPSVLDVYPYIDRVITYNKKDMTFYPLSEHFPTPTDLTIAEDSIFSDEKYDFCYVGSFTQYRYKKLIYIAKMLSASGFTYDFRLVTKSKFIERFCNFTTRERVPLLSLNAIYLNAKCVLEIPHPGDEGITQRVLHAISLNKKILVYGAKNYSNYEHVSDSIYYVNSVNDFNKNVLSSFVLKNASVKKDVLSMYSYSAWAKMVINNESV
ncbi:hypothetical protein [Pectobacterium aroidearum]|uniref:hypothetical protein n=1 Tax=Pectobacterium aroidearum TaxID=1201031 RepID=UPI0026068709|nr:hypothetical protein [Pectobacterium aroidearum]WKA63799.1 hypothetical protein QX495_06620 [Pectobacterium aroidearum]